MSAQPSPTPAGVDLTPDLAEARRFLAALAPREALFTFQTYDDNKPRGDARLVKTLHGTFDQHATRLEALNAKGAAICVVINRTDGQGRSDKNVTGVRALFADLDGVPRRNVERLPLGPHILVESSPGRFHAYYRVDDVPRDRFTAAQTELVDLFDSDPVVTDLPRVMRLPGFLHQKPGGAPFRTKLLHHDADREAYRLADFPTGAAEPGGNTVVEMPQPEEREKALEMAREKAARTHQNHDSRRSAMHQLAFDLRAAGISQPSANLAAKRFAQECRPTNSDGELEPFTEKEARDIVANAYRPGKVVRPRPADDDSDKRKREATAVEEMNKKHALVLTGGKHLILWERPGCEPDFLKESGFAAFYRNEFVGKKSKATLWLSHPARRSYVDVVFAPGRDAGDAYNLWTGLAVSPSDNGCCAIFLDHLRENVANGDAELFRWIEAWLAQIVQRPAQKVGTSLVLRGAQGTGKTKVGEVMSKLLGSHYLLVDDPRYVVGNFNAHLARVILLHADEAFFAGDRGALGKLRSLVTSDKTMLERKGLDAIRVDNFMRLLITSDRSWVVHAAVEERRFAIVDMSDKRRQDTAYFKAMDAELEAGGYAALLKHLLAVDVDAVDLRTIPKTKALQDQKAHSMDAVQLFWYTRLQDGEIVVDSDDWPREIAKSALYQEYLKEGRDTNQRYRLNDKQFGIELKKLCPMLDTCKVWVSFKLENGNEDSKRVNGYRLPDLAACRAAFDAASGTEIDWPDVQEMPF